MSKLTNFLENPRLRRQKDFENIPRNKGGGLNHSDSMVGLRVNSITLIIFILIREFNLEVQRLRPFCES